MINVEPEMLHSLGVHAFKQELGSTCFRYMGAKDERQKAAWSILLKSESLKTAEINRKRLIT